MSTVPHTPAPPAGPGVYPPFPAPPVEGKGKRIGLGLGIAAGVLVLVCGGGLAAMIGVGVSTSGALEEQAHAAVRDYLAAVQQHDYDEAYEMLCQQTQGEQTRDEFRQRVAAMTPIRSYTLGDLNPITLAVPIDAVYVNGQSGDLEAYLGQDTNTGAFEVCELAE